ncbi:MAG: efflux RND transporter periplasmic adaptor subunit [Bacteroidales bacterium]|nr:efflux RND transporter periplasmic adaptor subunit [Bacteroidales bacterium]
MKKAILAGLLLASLSACSHKEASAPESGVTVANGIITLSENSPLLNYIETGTVEQRSYTPSFSTSGQVRALPSAFVQIRVPFTGVIASTNVRPGQKVAKGTPLFTINSADYADRCRALLEAREELAQAERTLSRRERLFESRVGSQSEVEEARMEVEIKRQAAAQAAAAIEVFGVNPANIRMGQPLTIYSPIAGKVVTDNIVPGQYVKEDEEPLLEIANLEKVWVVANVKEKDLALVSRCEKVEIEHVAMPDTIITGRIEYVSDILDADSRSAELVVECDNRNGLLKPNMFGTVRVTDAPTEALLVPAAAILQDENTAYVVMVEGDRSFRKVPVVTDGEADGMVPVRKGLKAGDRILVKGAFYFIEY